jgi:hypothetical protein
MAENSSHELEHASHGRLLRRMGMDVRTPRNRGRRGCISPASVLKINSTSSTENAALFRQHKILCVQVF